MAQSEMRMKKWSKEQVKLTEIRHIHRQKRDIQRAILCFYVRLIVFVFILKKLNCFKQKEPFKTKER